MATVVLATPPSPPFVEIDRQAAGGMGICSPCGRPTVGHGPYAQYDLGLLWTAGALLNAGHNAIFIDGQAEQLDEPGFVCRIRQGRPDFLVGMVQFASLDFDLQLLQAARRACGGVPLIVVGSAIAIVTDDVLACPAVDYAVVGESEATVTELIDALTGGKDVAGIRGLAWRRDGQTCRTGPRGPTDLSRLPRTAFSLLAPYRYKDAFYFRPDRIGLIATTRGCPFRCGYYCPYPAAYGRKTRFRPPGLVLEEIEQLVREFGVRSFYFRDQVFTVNPPHAREICRRIIESKLEIRWICETRFDLLHDDSLLEEMRRAGCVQIHFGLESGDPRLFQAIGKPGCTLEMARQTIARVVERGIRVHLHLILGLPGESWATVKHTAAFLAANGVTRTNITRCTPYPGTALYAEANRRGWIRTRDWSRYGQDFVMGTGHMSPWELELAEKYLIWKSCGNRVLSGLPRRDKLFRPVLTVAIEQFL